MKRKALWKGSLVVLVAAAIAVAWFVPRQASAVGTFTEDQLKEAAERMQALKIVSGRTDGDLALGDSITRAEMVTMIVRAFGKEQQAALLKGAPSFEDVSANSWASGYIAVAKQMVEENGQVIGRTNSTFDPNGLLTAAEAEAFIMKFIGVSPKAGPKWPDNYIQGAVNAGLVTSEVGDYLNKIKNIPATRGQTFLFTDMGFSSKILEGGKSVYTTYIDTKPPTLTVDTKLPEISEEAKLTVSGTASDNDKVKVSIGGNVVEVGKDGKWTGTLELNTCGDTYKITAFDVAGNETTKEVTVKMTDKARSVAKKVYSCPAK
ncbi:hypothetical protein [Cohnella caldifontis]|uniref:hypothetical protein n=1 Tax=Cohnella caldifontis TaxID=3027471 RepID=UPI0023EB2490|nr:hypothetical protein [Cohnella sp. YIM B05605]